jgi:hypothetical protein
MRDGWREPSREGDPPHCIDPKVLWRAKPSAGTARRLRVNVLANSRIVLNLCRYANGGARCGPALFSVPAKDLENDEGGSHKRKGRLRCHKQPKSREETPKEGSDSGMGMEVRYHIALAKAIVISTSIARR